jgi:hypothetical protein
MADKKYKRIYRMLARFGFELLTIIAGILIALFVNNWQVRNHDMAMLKSTLNSLSQEFEENIENINRIQPRLERFRDTLEFYKSNTGLSIYELTTRAPGLGTAELHTTNWQTTLSSGSIRLLDFETVTLLSKIDSKHQELKNETAQLISIIYSPALYRKDEEGYHYRKVLGDWIGSYLGNEQELIVLYDEFKELVGKENY